MENCEITLEGDQLVIRIDLTQECGLTRSGKSVCVATTGGNINLWQDGQIRPELININCFRKISKAEQRAGQVALKRGDDND